MSIYGNNQVMITTLQQAEAAGLSKENALAESGSEEGSSSSEEGALGMPPLNEVSDLDLEQYLSVYN